jgi:hypothetical protein
MANSAPSMAALKQIGDILYGLKAHPQFQTEITNAAMEMHITDPARLLNLIDERLHSDRPQHNREVVAAVAPAPSAALVAALPASMPRPQGIYSGGASLEGVGDLAAPTFPSAAQYTPPAPALVTQPEPTPIAHTTAGFIASASLGVDQFRPLELPDVRPRATEQSNDFGNSRA